MHAVRVRATWLTLAASLVVTLAVAAPASAGTKPFSLVMSPPTVSAGSAQITATFKNETSSQQLGSANLTAPSGFTVTSASRPGPGSASVVNNVVQLRGLGVPPGQSVATTMTVTTPASAGCSSTTGTWAVQAKQANDFSGLPGNDMNLDGANSRLTTTVTGPCALRFGVQPHSAVVNQHITGTDYDSAGPPVTVQIVDSAGNVVSTAAAPVTVALAQNPGGATLAGTKTVNAVNGVATFGDLALNKVASGYTLTASSASLSGANSNSFDTQQQAVQCNPNQTCQSDVNNGTTDASVNAGASPNSGVLTESLDTGPELKCAGYTPPGPDWVSFLMSDPTRTKIVQLAVKTSLIGSVDALIAAQQACFGAPYQFSTTSGSATKTTWPNGTVEYVGLLPNCPSSGPLPGPCVSSRTDNVLGSQLIIAATVPAGLPSDPRMH